MSGNSADSYSEGESEGEHVKEKPEGPITAAAPDPPPTLLYVRKGKTNGRVGRPKKLKNSQPPLPSPPPPSVHRRRGSGLQKSKLVIYNSHVILQFKQNGRMFVFYNFLTGKRGVLKRPWSEAERAAVEEHLTQNITELRVPAKADCERCLQQCPLLVNNHRDWRAIKFYCHNRIQLLKKNQRRENELQPLTVCWWRGGGDSCTAADGSRLSNGTLLTKNCTTFETMVLNFSSLFQKGDFFFFLMWLLMSFVFLSFWCSI